MFKCFSKVDFWMENRSCVFQNSLHMNKEMELYRNSKFAAVSINKEESHSDSTEAIFKFLRYFGI